MHNKACQTLENTQRWFAAAADSDAQCSEFSHVEHVELVVHRLAQVQGVDGDLATKTPPCAPSMWHDLALAPTKALKDKSMQLLFPAL